MKKYCKRIISGTFITGFILIILLGVQPMLAFAGFDIQTSTENDKNVELISHDNIVYLTDKFIDTIVQDTDSDYRVIDYDSKEKLLNTFKTIATREVAQVYIDFYFKEEDNGLYIVPTETPPWFNPNNDYDVVQLNHDQVAVIQENQSDLYGDYSIEIEFTREGEDWRISQVTH